MSQPVTSDTLFSVIQEIQRDLESVQRTLHTKLGAICAGAINADGTISIAKGATFTSTQDSTGVYTITFETEIPDTAVAVALAEFGCDVGLLMRSTSIIQVSTTLAGVASDKAFDFIVI